MTIPEERVADFVGPSWAPVLTPLFNRPLTMRIVKAIAEERKTHDIFPHKDDVFRAFRECPYDDLKAVIVGQDPYHTPGKAHGLAFSVPENEGIPPSLRNILKELEDDVGMHDPYQNPDLTRWANQGVLLLNTALTVRKGEANSHSDMWRTWTARVIQIMAEKFNPTVFVGWGSHAQAAIESHIDIFFHPYINSPHPSPFSASRGFFGSRPFSRINEFLEQQGKTPITW